MAGRNIDEEAYEEMIEALTRFSSEVMEASPTMVDQANECAENCEEDVASSNSRDQVVQYARQFMDCAERAQALAKAVAMELEMAKEAAEKARRV